MANCQELQVMQRNEVSETYSTAFCVALNSYLFKTTDRKLKTIFNIFFPSLL